MTVNVEVDDELTVSMVEDDGDTTDDVVEAGFVSV